MLESSQGDETQAHSDSFRPEIRALKAGRISFGGVQQTVDVDYESGPAPTPGATDLSVQSSTSVGDRRANAEVAANSRAAGLGSSEEPVKEPRSREKVTPSPLHHGGKALGEAFPGESVKSQALGNVSG